MRTLDHKRRSIMMGTLAAGTAFMLFGCGSKQEEAAIDTGESGTDGQAAPQTAQNAAAQQMSDEPTPKMSQEGALYQTGPLDDRKCQDCGNFIAESKTCKLVEGKVSEEGYCILWDWA